MADNYDRLLTNIKKIRQESSNDAKSFFDINKYILPHSEIAKNLAAIRNPGLQKEDLNFMFGGLDKLKSSGEQIPKSFSQVDGIEDLMDTDFKKSVTKNNIESFKRELSSSFVPIPFNDRMIDEAINLKEGMVYKFQQYVQKVLNVLKELGLAQASIANAIPGSIQFVIAPLFPLPAFNIPGMITLLTNVAQTLLNLKNKCMELKETLLFFEKLTIVCTRNNANVVAGVINKLYDLVDRTLCAFVEKIDDFILAIINAILSILGGNNKKKRAKQVTKQLRKTKYLPKGDFTHVSIDDRDSVSEILEEWEVIDRSNRNVAVRLKKEIEDGLNKSVEDLEKIKNINKEIKDLVKVGEDDGTQLNNIVYDVKFPDGNIIKGLSEEDIKKYEEDYIVIIRSILNDAEVDTNTE